MRRYDGDRTAALGEHAQNIVFHTKIVGHHFELGRGLRAEALAKLPFGLRPLIRGFGRNDFGQILPRHTTKTGSQSFGLRHVVTRIIANPNTAALRPFFTQHAGQRTRVDACDGDDMVRFQIIRQTLLGAEIAHNRWQILDDQPGGVDFICLDVFRVHTDIADVRISQSDHLAGIGRIGQNFLIAGHRGIEHHLSDCVAVRADGVALKHRAIGQRQDGFGKLGRENR